jgi:hypothetical protein
VLVPAGGAARLEFGAGLAGGLGFGRGCFLPFTAGGVGRLKPFPRGVHAAGQFGGGSG